MPTKPRMTYLITPNIGFKQLRNDVFHSVLFISKQSLHNETTKLFLLKHIWKISQCFIDRRPLFTGTKDKHVVLRKSASRPPSDGWSKDFKGCPWGPWSACRKQWTEDWSIRKENGTQTTGGKKSWTALHIIAWPPKTNKRLYIFK